MIHLRTLPERRNETVHVVPVFRTDVHVPRVPGGITRHSTAFPARTYRVRVHGEQVYPWGSHQKDSVAELPLDGLVGDGKPPASRRLRTMGTSVSRLRHDNVSGAGNDGRSGERKSCRRRRYSLSRQREVGPNVLVNILDAQMETRTTL